MIRKMYDAAPPVDAGGAAPPVQEPLSIAAQMAKAGKRSDSTPLGGPPRQATPPVPPKSEPTPPAPLPGETPKLAPPANEPPKTDVPPKTEPPAAPPKTEAPKAEKPWQEVLKSQQPAAVLKELGLSDKQVKLLETIKADPKMERFFDHWSNKGDVTAYFKALSVDFSKMSPEDVMKHSLRERNLEMSAEDFNELYDVKVVDRYKLDPERFSEAEVKRGRIELAADVKAEREALVKQQQDYLLSAAPEQAQDATAQILAYKEGEKQEADASKNAYEKYMNDDPFVKNIVSSKSIKIGEGEDAFNYTVENPQALLDLLFNTENFASKMFKSGADGNGDLIPDVEKQILVSAVLNDAAFVDKFAAHYQKVGAKKQLAEIENSSEPGGTPSRTDAQPATPAAAMATKGRIVRGDGQ